MSDQMKTFWKVELIWWALGFVLLAVIMFPIYSNFEHFPFLFQNAVFILVFFHFARMAFLWKYNPFQRNLVFKLIIIFTMIPLCVLLMDGLNEFQYFLDEQGVESLLPNLPLKEKLALGQYIQSEMFFFGVGSVIATVTVTFRLIISIWRVKNTDRV